MENIPYAKIEKGTFLIASPDHEAGIFFRAVILICEHNINGSFGLVINKPLHIDLPEELLHGETLESHQISIRAGGPVQTNQMMLLHSSDKIPEQTMRICDGVFLGGDLSFLQDLVQHEGQSDEEKSHQFPHVFLCFGYSGWSSGQLEREYLDGSWLLHKASSYHLFEVEPEKLWGTLLREMGGKYATLSMIPEDLSVN